MEGLLLGWQLSSFRFFESKLSDFYRRDIEKLVERWEEVVHSNEEYIID